MPREEFVEVEPIEVDSSSDSSSPSSSSSDSDMDSSPVTDSDSETSSSSSGDEIADPEGEEYVIEAEEYVIEAILDKRINSHGKPSQAVTYLCKWKDYGVEESTWVAGKYLMCPELIEAFEAQGNPAIGPEEDNTWEPGENLDCPEQIEAFEAAGNPAAPNAGPE
ncbi:Chromobox protein 3 [Folsomia candida]|uniref:Chromobox protein 3 n=1 Tax=Folsomia candida TaxID=158441 RepID=A0A226DRK4_FOLCA|nr:Chromobox protein 3 [Folsomia candida]